MQQVAYKGSRDQDVLRKRVRSMKIRVTFIVTMQNVCVNLIHKDIDTEMTKQRFSSHSIISIKQN